MKPVRYMTDDQLEYVYLDCREAIRAMPDGRNLERYVHEMRSCEHELNRRHRVRCDRDMLAWIRGDPLSASRRKYFAERSRLTLHREYHVSDFERQKARAAAISHALSQRAKRA